MITQNVQCLSACINIGKSMGNLLQCDSPSFTLNVITPSHIRCKYTVTTTWIWRPRHMTVTVTRTTQFVFKCQIVRTCNLYQKQRQGGHVRPSTQYSAVGHLLSSPYYHYPDTRNYTNGISTYGWMDGSCNLVQFVKLMDFPRLCPILSLFFATFSFWVIPLHQDTR